MDGMIKVLKRLKCFNNKGGLIQCPPCSRPYIYSLDEGKTWMAEKDYLRYKHQYFKVENYYDAD